MCSSGRSFKSSNIQSLINSEKDLFSINGYDSNRGFTLSIAKENLNQYLSRWIIPKQRQVGL